MATPRGLDGAADLRQDRLDPVVGEVDMLELDRPTCWTSVTASGFCCTAEVAASRSRSAPRRRGLLAGRQNASKKLHRVTAAAHSWRTPGRTERDVVCMTNQPPRASTPICARPGKESKGPERPAVILRADPGLEEHLRLGAEASCSWASWPNASPPNAP